MGLVQYAIGSEQQLKHYKASLASQRSVHIVYHQECVVLQLTEKCGSSNIPARLRVCQLFDSAGSIDKLRSRLHHAYLLHGSNYLGSYRREGIEEFKSDD